MSQDPENENFRKISGRVFLDFTIRVNKYGIDAKEATTLDGRIENSEN